MTESKVQEEFFNSNDCRYLYSSSPLIVNPEIATALGLVESIIIQQIKYWLAINEKANKKDTHFHEGRWWTYNSLNEWQKTNFPFLSYDTLKRAFRRLTQDFKVLITNRFHADPRNRTIWYTIDYLELNKLLHNALGQNPPMDNSNSSDPLMNNSVIGLSTKKVGDSNTLQPSKIALGQNAPMEEGKMPQCIYTDNNLQRITTEREEKKSSLSKDNISDEALKWAIGEYGECKRTEIEHAIKKFKLRSPNGTEGELKLWISREHCLQPIVLNATSKNETSLPPDRYQEMVDDNLKRRETDLERNIFYYIANLMDPIDYIKYSFLLLKIDFIGNTTITLKHISRDICHMIQERYLKNILKAVQAFIPTVTSVKILTKS